MELRCEGSSRQHCSGLCVCAGLPSHVSFLAADGISCSCLVRLYFGLFLYHMSRKNRIYVLRSGFQSSRCSSAVILKLTDVLKLVSRRSPLCHYRSKTSQFKTACKDDSGYITQLKVSQNSASGHHHTTLSDYIFATKARINSRKKTC